MGTHDDKILTFFTCFLIWDKRSCFEVKVCFIPEWFLWNKLSFQETPDGSLSDALCSVSPEPIELHLRTGDHKQEEYQTQAQCLDRDVGRGKDLIET